MSREIQVNLAQNKVRVYDHGKPVIEYSDVVTGPATLHLLHKKSSTAFHIEHKFHRTAHGLVNFVGFHGNFGFHSNQWYHDRKHPKFLSRIPGVISHGCVRIPHEKSRQFFESVHHGDYVVINRDSWQTPTYGAPTYGKEVAQ
jgi:hypothetical protein